MASKMVGMVLAIVLIVSISGGATAQSGCTNALMDMSSCLSFITGNISTPSSLCCLQIGNVVQSQPQCLCQVLNGAGIALGININRTLAQTLLNNACNVQSPSLSQCNVVNGAPTTPTPTSAAAPEGSTSKPDILPESPTESDTPSGSGSKTYGLTSNGSQSQVHLHLLAHVMFVVLWASTVTSFG